MTGVCAFGRAIVCAAGISTPFNKHFTLELYYMRQNDGRSRPGDLNLIWSAYGGLSCENGTHASGVLAHATPRLSDRKMKGTHAPA